MSRIEEEINENTHTGECQRRKEREKGKKRTVT